MKSRWQGGLEKISEGACTGRRGSGNEIETHDWLDTGANESVRVHGSWWSCAGYLMEVFGSLLECESVRVHGCELIRVQNSQWEYMKVIQSAWGSRWVHGRWREYRGVNESQGSQWGSWESTRVMGVHNSWAYMRVKDSAWELTKAPEDRQECVRLNANAWELMREMGVDGGAWESMLVRRNLER